MVISGNQQLHCLVGVGPESCLVQACGVLLAEMLHDAGSCNQVGKSEHVLQSAAMLLCGHQLIYATKHDVACYSSLVKCYCLH